MSNKIVIGPASQTQTENGSKICFDLKIRDHSYTLEYDVYGEGITTIPERSDAVVVSFLIYAVKFGLDIVTELPLSKTLYYNITKHIIPQMVLCNPGKGSYINIDAPLTDEVYPNTWNGTGVSLGIDSFSTIYEYTADCALEDYKLTHLVHLKVGAHSSHKYSSEEENSLFDAEHKNVEKYCNKFNHKLITVESNLRKICYAEFPYMTIGKTHTYNNLGTIMLLQNYFKRYYYASAYNLDHFGLNTIKDPAEYEKWLIPLLETENLKLYSANMAMTRIEKTKYISAFPETYDSLHVCWDNAKNCGVCRKCLRTLVTLDILGLLDTYKNSFDVEAYRKNRRKNINRVIAMRSADALYNEIYKYMKANNIQTPGFFEIFWTKVKITASTVVNHGFGYLVNRIKLLKR